MRDSFEQQGPQESLSVPEPASPSPETLEHALQSRDTAIIDQAIQELNQYLIWRPGLRRKPLPAEIDNPSDFQNFLRALDAPSREIWFKIYLGDSGLSRIVVRLDLDGKIQFELTANSTDDVRKRWADITNPAKEY